MAVWACNDSLTFGTFLNFFDSFLIIFGECCVCRFGASICGASDVHSKLCHSISGDVGAGRGVHGHVLLLLALLRLHERNRPLQLRVFPTLGVPRLSSSQIPHLHPHVNLLTPSPFHVTNPIPTSKPLLKYQLHTNTIFFIFPVFTLPIFFIITKTYL